MSETEQPDTPHDWQETDTGCEDCGSHPGVICQAEDHYERGLECAMASIDLVWQEDPRD